MRPSTGKILLLALAIGLVGAQTESSCTPFTAADVLANPGNGITAMYWYFGSNEGGGSTLYEHAIYNGRYSPMDLYVDKTGADNSAFYNSFLFLNQVPIEGGKNLTFSLDTIDPNFVPTANFTCLSNSSAMWGPSYPEYKGTTSYIRGSHPNLEVYTYFSAPTETSYIRTIYFIKNTGATAERVRMVLFNRCHDFGTDVSPLNDQRYYTAFGYEAGDNGYYNNNPAARWPSTLHAHGQKALDKTSALWADMDNNDAGVSYITHLAAGEQFAYMHIKSIGTNKTTALKTAAEIDSEPDYIFHDLTADQLSLIRNWGGCQAIIGPTATVTVTPPAQCSTGLTSDFTVQASSSRTDLTADFTHQVVGIQNVVMVPAQSSTTLSVPNDVGAVRHQLWYKGCLVRETEFTACTTAAAPVAPVSAPVASAPVANTPSKVNDASSLAVVSVLSLVAAVALF